MRDELQRINGLFAEFIRVIYHRNEHFSDSEGREQKTDIRGQRSEIRTQELTFFA